MEDEELRKELKKINEKLNLISAQINSLYISGDKNHIDPQQPIYNLSEELNTKEGE